NRFAVRLALPADKFRPVVGERQLENSHRLTTKVTKSTKTTKSLLVVVRVLRRTARRDHVLDHENFLTRGNRESPPQRQLAVLPLGKNRSNTKRTADLLPDDDAAERRRQDHVRRKRTHMFGNRRSTRLGFGRMLQDERTLQVPGAVKSGRQPEVSLQQRAHTSKPIQHGSRRSVSGCHNVIIRS